MVMVWRMQPPPPEPDQPWPPACCPSGMQGCLQDLSPPRGPALLPGAWGRMSPGTIPRCRVGWWGAGAALLEHFPVSICSPQDAEGLLVSPRPPALSPVRGVCAGDTGRAAEPLAGRAWREPMKQSWVLISYRSHATTFCSGCCPTFQSHTFASDFNGLHHSPKLYLTKREESWEAAARNQSSPAPGDGHVLGIACCRWVPWGAFVGCRARSQPQQEGAAGDGDSTHLSSNSATSRSLCTPCPVLMLHLHTSIFLTKGFSCFQKGKTKLHLNGDLHYCVCVCVQAVQRHPQT